MTTTTQILRICSKRMVSATCTRNLTVVTSPLLFRNDTSKYSAVTGTGMSVTRTENWFKRKYNDIKNSYTQVANRVRKLYVTFYYILMWNFSMQLNYEIKKSEIKSYIYSMQLKNLVL